MLQTFTSVTLESDQDPTRPEERAPTRCWVSVPSCLLLACFYVGSLYIWRSSLPRDHPSVEKHRCATVLLVSAASPAFVKTCLYLADIRVGVSLWELMGVRVEGFLPAAVLPLTVLYVRPLAQSAVENPNGFSGELQSALDVQSWRRCVAQEPGGGAGDGGAGVQGGHDACAAALHWTHSWGPHSPAFLCSHFHHIIEQWHLGKENMSVIFLEAWIQLLYTTLFGAFAAFIILRTGHVVGPVLCHSFCNSQGLPDFTSALNHPRRSALLPFYLMGVLLFLVLLLPLTDPFFYGAVPISSLAPLQTSEC